ncbi:hypothetical protein [Nonomuraea sp. SYSU D8015]|uniref:hypothetical protein n=1 Tax=Nonomuraea sp. SYSU D8015 TaxID=2593644 RepID=UPI001CB6C0F2|nr:hypothetical protein [Nonomuraea sp. SYSU D8015]
MFARLAAACGSAKLLDVARGIGGSPIPRPHLGGALGACHSLDVPLAFGTLDSPVAARLIGDEPTPEAVTLTHELKQAWIRFVTTGDAG